MTTFNLSDFTVKTAICNDICHTGRVYHPAIMLLFSTVKKKKNGEVNTTEKNNVIYMKKLVQARI